MTSSLMTALSGLRMSQQQINTIAANVSNVGTPGYSRKILPQSTQTVDGRAIGVSPETIIRNVDINLTRNLWTQVSATSELTVQKTYLNRIEQFHGPPDQELSIAANLSDLKDSFAALADSPEDQFLQATTVNNSIDMAEKFNDLAELINTTRNDVQGDMVDTINRINNLVEQIGELNVQVQSNLNVGRSIAQAQDDRDNAIKELSELMEISFFERGDGVLVVQTSQGVELAGDEIQQLYFSPLPLSATNAYPASAAPIYVRNPLDDPAAFDITTTDVGGRLGGLITLRDETFPKQMAQLDELAHKTALRFEAQGLRLFTDPSGTIPADTAPDPSTNTAVPYVGFASIIQVNNSIIEDNTLLQNGTYGATNIESGSNEVIRRVIENTFTSIDYQTINNIDPATQIDLLNRPAGVDLQTWIGVTSENTIEGTRNLTAFADVNALITSANGALDPTNDTFRITFEDSRIPLGPTSIDISMAAAQLQPGANAADQIVAEINAQIAGIPVPAGLAASASVGPDGQILIDTRGSYTVDSAAPANAMGTSGLVFLGIADNAGSPVAPEDPYFDIHVGNNQPTRITIEPGDTHTDLINKLNAVEGLAVDTVGFAADGILRLRPGDNYDNPNFGGDITIVSGPFKTNSAAYASSAGPVPPATTGTRATIDDGANVVSALFGTYSVSGTRVIDTSPLTNVTYGSETNGSALPPIPTVGFRNQYLGPDASVTTGIINASSIVEYAQNMVNEHASEINLIESRESDEEALRELLSTQILNESGVNLDEELAHLIVVQTAYGASARVITAVDEMFQELLNSI